jgi:nitroimidazol reductase NimA-like FMN-containing flavoprotein (pyridoxamine 5'-phosphate oxidase superfamily)
MADSTRMTQTALTDSGAAPWSLAEERLTNPERARTYWLATVLPDGAPHVMPLIGTWLDGAFYFVSGEETRKGRNLAHEPRCVIAGSSTALPSLDLIVEGIAERVTDEGTLRRVTDAYRTRLEWPLEVRDGRVVGPNAPTAGPPPYAVFRVAPTTIFGLPGTAGMDQFDPAELPHPTRWDFTRASG